MLPLPGSPRALTRTRTLVAGLTPLVAAFCAAAFSACSGPEPRSSLVTPPDGQAGSSTVAPNRPRPPGGGDLSPGPIVGVGGSGAVAPSLEDAGSSDAAAPSGDVDAGDLDAGAPPPSAGCVFGPFGAPELVAGIDVRQDLWAPALSSDGLTLYYAASDDGSTEQIFSATRTDLASATFAGAAPLPGLGGNAADGTPFVSADGLRLYFYSQRGGGPGGRDIWLATRPNPNAAFTAPTVLDGVNTPSAEHLPWLSADELVLLFVSSRDGGLGQSDVWIARRAAASGPFTSLVPLAEINTTLDEGRAVLSRDGRTLFFSSTREGGQGGHDLWAATRASADAPFTSITNLSAVNSASNDIDPFLSPDERELYFVSGRNDQTRIWRTTRSCTEP